VGFAQVVAGKDGKKFLKIECHKCHKLGHYANQCPEHQHGSTNTQTSTSRNNEDNGDHAGSDKGSININVSSWSCFLKKKKAYPIQH